MKNTNLTAIEAALAGTAVVISAGMVPAALAAAPATPATMDQAAAVQQDATTLSGTVKLAEVQGTFAFDQSDVTPTADIQKSFLGTDAYLCGAQVAAGEAVPLDQWQIAVSGDVSSQFTATLAELADDNALTVQMGCACAGNGADQRVAANAMVTGVTLMDIMARAGVSPDVNTVTFTSADGFTVSLPLSYLKQRYTLVVYGVNGEPLANSMGGTNQLWLGSTAARYFVRDITAITFEKRAEADVPPIPGTAAAGDYYANTPNIALLTSKA